MCYNYRILGNQDAFQQWISFYHIIAVYSTAWQVFDLHLVKGDDNLKDFFATPLYQHLFHIIKACITTFRLSLTSPGSIVSNSGAVPIGFDLCERSSVNGISHIDSDTEIRGSNDDHSPSSAASAGPGLTPLLLPLLTHPPSNYYISSRSDQIRKPVWQYPWRRGFETDQILLPLLLYS